MMGRHHSSLQPTQNTEVLPNQSLRSNKLDTGSKSKRRLLTVWCHKLAGYSIGLAELKTLLQPMWTRPRVLVTQTGYALHPNISKHHQHWFQDSLARIRMKCITRRLTRGSLSTRRGPHKFETSESYAMLTFYKESRSIACCSKNLLRIQNISSRLEVAILKVAL